MIPAPFDYEVAESVEHAVELLGGRDDAKLLAPSADLIRGRSEIEAFWRAGLEAGVCDAEFVSLELGYEGRLAYEVGRYTLWLDPSGDAEPAERGAYVLVHERQPDGTWQRAVEMFNPETARD